MREFLAFSLGLTVIIFISGYFTRTRWTRLQLELWILCFVIECTAAGMYLGNLSVPASCLHG
jgi:hypothetical protein